MMKNQKKRDSTEDNHTDDNGDGDNGNDTNNNNNGLEDENIHNNNNGIKKRRSNDKQPIDTNGRSKTTRGGGSIFDDDDDDIFANGFGAAAAAASFGSAGGGGGFTGFSWGSNKKVTISEEHMKQARMLIAKDDDYKFDDKMLDDDDDSFKPINNSNNNNNNNNSNQNSNSLNHINKSRSISPPQSNNNNTNRTPIKLSPPNISKNNISNNNNQNINQQNNQNNQNNQNIANITSNTPQPSSTPTKKGFLYNLPQKKGFITPSKNNSPVQQQQPPQQPIQPPQTMTNPTSPPLTAPQPKVEKKPLPSLSPPQSKPSLNNPRKNTNGFVSPMKFNSPQQQSPTTTTTTTTTQSRQPIYNSPNQTNINTSSSKQTNNNNNTMAKSINYNSPNIQSNQNNQNNGLKKNTIIDNRKKLKDLGTPFTDSPIGLVTKEVLEINRKNCCDFEFDCNTESKELGFKQKHIGESQIYIYLTKEKPNLQLSQEWVRNHYGWIIWKLASMEKAFPKQYGGNYLTLTRVLEQLKKRIQKELVESKRSILKMIYERDYPPDRFMILCISDVLNLGQQQPQDNNNQNNNDNQDGTTIQQQQAIIELTDGWYSIKTILDPHLSFLLKQGKLFIGQKLRIQSAKLTGGGKEGVSPLEEESEQVYLSIFTNSTRRAKWYEKFGLSKCSSSGLGNSTSTGFPITLKSIIPGGGMVQSIHVQLLKIYPNLYQETLSYQGKTIITKRNQSDQDKYQSDMDSKRSYFHEEKLFEISERYNNEKEDIPKIQAHKFTPSYLSKIQDSTTLYHMYKQTQDPNEFYMKLDQEQQSLLDKEVESRKNELNQRIQDEVMEQTSNSHLFAERSETLILRLKVSDLLQSNQNQSNQNNQNNGNGKIIYEEDDDELMNNNGKQDQVIIKTPNGQKFNSKYLTSQQLFDSVVEPPLYLPSNNFNPSNLPDLKHYSMQSDKPIQFNPLPPIQYDGSKLFKDQQQQNNNSNQNNNEKYITNMVSSSSSSSSKQQEIDNINEMTETILSFTNPTPDLVDQLKEGHYYTFYYIQPKQTTYNAQYQQNRKANNIKISHLKSSKMTSIVEIENPNLMVGNQSFINIKDQQQQQLNNNQNNNNNSLTQTNQISEFKTKKMGVECELTGLLLYVGSVNTQEIEYGKDKSRIQVSRIIYMVDESCSIAKILLSKSTLIISNQQQQNQQKQQPNNSNNNNIVEKSITDLSFPYQEGFTFNHFNRSLNSYPIIHIGNIQYQSYDTDTQLTSFQSPQQGDVVIDCTMKPKDRKLQTRFQQLQQWFTKSSGLYFMAHSFLNYKFFNLDHLDLIDFDFSNQHHQEEQQENLQHQQQIDVKDKEMDNNNKNEISSTSTSKQPDIIPTTTTILKTSNNSEQSDEDMNCTQPITSINNNMDLRNIDFG